MPNSECESIVRACNDHFLLSTMPKPTLSSSIDPCDEPREHLRVGGVSESFGVSNDRETANDHSSINIQYILHRVRIKKIGLSFLTLNSFGYSSV